MNNDSYKIKLQEEKRLLEEELTSVGRTDSKGDWEAVPDTEDSKQEVLDEADMAERSEDFQERSSVLKTLEERLDSVKLALSKIESGKYGVCESCGKEIEPKRLEVNPAASTCEACM